jgi:hypothetical protein
MSSDIKKKIMRLEAYCDSPSPILSVYFKLPVPKKVRSQTLINDFNTLINKNLSLEEREELKINIEYINGFMQTYRQQHTEKAIAFFSGGDNLFEVIHLPYNIKSTVKYAHSPYIRPIENALKSTKRYLVILNDRRRAILYTLFSGTLEDQKTVEGDTVPQDAQGRWANSLRTARQDKMQRHIRDHLRRHFKIIAQKASRFAGRKEINGVIIGGHRKDIGKFEESLPRELKEKVIGSFVSGLHENINDIVSKSMNVAMEADRRLSRVVRLRMI